MTHVIITPDADRIPVTARPRDGAPGQPIDLVEANGAVRWVLTYEHGLTLDGVEQPDADIYSAAQIAEAAR